MKPCTPRDLQLIEKGKDLYNKIEYNKVLYLGGFIKTTLSSAFIGSGTVILLDGLTHTKSSIIKNNELSVMIGAISILTGIIIVYTIDLYRKRYKEREMGIIQEEIQHKAEEIASKAVQEELEELEKTLCK